MPFFRTLKTFPGKIIMCLIQLRKNQIALENRVIKVWESMLPMLFVRVSVIQFLMTEVLSFSISFDSLLWKNSSRVLIYWFFRNLNPIIWRVSINLVLGIKTKISYTVSLKLISSYSHSSIGIKYAIFIKWDCACSLYLNKKSTLEVYPACMLSGKKCLAFILVPDTSNTMESF